MTDACGNECLLLVKELVPAAIGKALEAKVFRAKWKMIVSKLEEIPSCLSDLLTHPCFSKNALCMDLFQAVCSTLKESIKLAELCVTDKYSGKLRMQSDLHGLWGKLELNIRDCEVLVKKGLLGETTRGKELFARLQIGDLEGKCKALDDLFDALKADESKVFNVLGRSEVSALVQLLTATSPRVREKSVVLVCAIAEFGSCDSRLVSEGVLPPLIRVVENGSSTGKEKATICLQRLSLSVETSRAIVGHGGVRPLLDVCRNGDSVSQAAAAGALKNISAIPDIRQMLADEGIVRVMIKLLDSGSSLGSKEYAAECLQKLTASNEYLRRNVILEGGMRSLLSYLDTPVPQKYAVWALRNLVGAVSMEVLVSIDFLPRVVHVLTSGTLGAKQAAASAICRVCSSIEMKKRVGEAGCIPLLVKMLEAETNNVREVAAQALSSLVLFSKNCRQLKKDEKSVTNLVKLLDASMQNTAKKYAISCLTILSMSKKCKKLMLSYGAIGYLKNLVDMNVPGSKKLLERLEKGKLRSLFSQK